LSKSETKLTKLTKERSKIGHFPFKIRAISSKVNKKTLTRASAMKGEFAFKREEFG